MIKYFTDPVLAAPTIGSMLMCVIAAFVGTFSVLKRQSLVAEALSHASYPGVICSLLLGRVLFDQGNDWHDLYIPLIGAAITSLLGMYCIQKLTTKYKIASDSALCFVLASFFGVALVILSGVQSSYPTLYRELQSYLFGQAATQTSVHVILYARLALVALGLCFCFYRPIKAVIFDPEFAKAIGIDVRKVEVVLLAVTVLAVVVGIRSLGVVLMSAMFIFPAVASRLWTARLELVLLLASLFGLISGFFGVYLSHEMSQIISDTGQYTSFPTGPMIVLSGAVLFIGSSILSPQKGLLFRGIRRFLFRINCQQENLLKVLWKLCSAKNSPLITRQEIQSHFQAGFWELSFLIWALKRNGWLTHARLNSFELTASGMLWARKIIRLHRLWEVYLVEYCGIGKDRVHPSAEEMEHIITPEIEAELEVLLHYPQQDPHKQPIPAHEANLLQP